MHKKNTNNGSDTFFKKPNSMFEVKKNLKPSFSFNHINFFFFMNSIPLYKSYRETVEVIYLLRMKFFFFIFMFFMCLHKQ